MAAGILECDRSHLYPSLLYWNDISLTRATLQQLRKSDILCKHHLLVYTLAWYFWCQQVSWTICYDDWQNGKSTLKHNVNVIIQPSLWFRERFHLENGNDCVIGSLLFSKVYANGSQNEGIYCYRHFNFSDKLPVCLIWDANDAPFNITTPRFSCNDKEGRPYHSPRHF